MNENPFPFKIGDALRRITRATGSPLGREMVTIVAIGEELFLGTDASGTEYSYRKVPYEHHDWSHWEKIPDSIPERWICWLYRPVSGVLAIMLRYPPWGQEDYIAVLHVASDGTCTWEKRT